MAEKIHMPYTVKNVYKHVDNVDNLFAKELFTNIYNVSGAHSAEKTVCHLLQTERNRSTGKCT